jgi:hypothetical protein
MLRVRGLHTGDHCYILSFKALAVKQNDGQKQPNKIA